MRVVTTPLYSLRAAEVATSFGRTTSMLVPIASVSCITRCFAPAPIAPVTITAATPPAMLTTANVAFTLWANSPLTEIRKVRSIFIARLLRVRDVRREAPAERPPAVRRHPTQRCRARQQAMDWQNPNASDWLLSPPPRSRGLLPPGRQQRLWSLSPAGIEGGYRRSTHRPRVAGRSRRCGH